MQNGNQNSRIEIYLGVIRNLLEDLADLIEVSNLRLQASWVRANIARDLRYIERRVSSEGLPFLTITMPLLGKWYDSVLAARVCDIPCGFKPHTVISDGDNQVSCPLFCHMLMCVLRDDHSLLRDKARIIRAYRSLFFLFYKLEVPFTDEQLRVALQKWKENEEELESFDFPSYFDSDLIEGRDIISKLFHPDYREFTKIHPSHGPGAVAGGEDNEEKWETAHFIPSLHFVYPYYDLYFGYRSAGRVTTAMMGEYINFRKKSKVIDATSRLLFVPKDSRGPRTISCEPKELMFVQQGVWKNLKRSFSDFSSGRIQFVDQTVNGQLALRSAENQEFATVDLKDASDRVTTKLVELLFPEGTLKFLRALRSYNTLLPDGSIHMNHKKYAPMGSALCFPIESAIFWALSVVAGINSGMQVAEAKASTYVYGDDIIVRPQVFPYLVKILSKFALKVNVDKSYVEGPFRESCGVDAWNGFNITPIKIKKDIGLRSLSGSLATAMCEYSSRCFALDYRKTGEYLYRLVDEAWPGTLVHDRPLGCLSVIDETRPLDLKTVKHGFSVEKCSVWVSGWVVSYHLKPCSLDGLSRFLRATYGSWEEHDPATVVDLRTTKIRKRKVSVERVR